MAMGFAPPWTKTSLMNVVTSISRLPLIITSVA
jgi:hypothetical protein